MIDVIRSRCWRIVAIIDSPSKPPLTNNCFSLEGITTLRSEPVGEPKWAKVSCFLSQANPVSSTSSSRTLKYSWMKASSSSVGLPREANNSSNLAANFWSMATWASWEDMIKDSVEIMRAGRRGRRIRNFASTGQVFIDREGHLLFPKQESSAGGSVLLPQCKLPVVCICPEI